MVGKAVKREEVFKFLDSLVEEGKNKVVHWSLVMVKCDVGATYARDNMQAYAIAKGFLYRNGELFLERGR